VRRKIFEGGKKSAIIKTRLHESCHIKGLNCFLWK